MKADVVRVLTWFDKESDEFIGEAELVGLELTTLRYLFGEWPDDPLYYDCYPVRQPCVKILTKHLSAQVTINLDRYDYFVECSTR